MLNLISTGSYNFNFLGNNYNYVIGQVVFDPPISGSRPAYGGQYITDDSQYIEAIGPTKPYVKTKMTRNLVEYAINGLPPQQQS